MIIKKIGLFLLLVGIALITLFSACAAPKKEVSQFILKKSPPMPSQPEKLEELMVPLLEERKKPERLINFSLRDADIREALLSFSKTTGYNIVLDTDVAGKATVEANRVTPFEALDALLTPLGLQYEIKNHIIRISKFKKQTRVFPLNYISTKRTGNGSFTTGITSGGGGSGSGTITNTDLADLWTDIETGLNDHLSEEGKITIYKMPGLIVVNDFLLNLKRIAEFLERVEGSIQRQVMIQAKVIDVILSDDYQLGIDWSAINKISGLRLQGGTREGRMFSQSLSPNTGIFQTAFTSQDFSLVLDAMSKQGKLNIISSPKISSLNNQKAAIKVVTSEVVYDVTTKVDPETKERTTEVTSKTVDAGVVLEVTPQISHDGNTIMNIHPIITEKIGESTFESQDIKLTSPILTVRETNTVLKVPDGRTFVIAGLIREKKEEKETKIPLLGDIPGLGNIFKKKVKNSIKSELVIFLTATILTGKRIEEFSWEELKRLNLE